MTVHGQRQHLVLLAIAFSAGVIDAVAGTTVTAPYAGIVRYNVVGAIVNGRSVNYQVMVLNLLDSGISFFLTPSNGALADETTRQTTRNFATAHATEVAINTHYFATGLSPQTTVTGIAASNGDVYSPFDLGSTMEALNISIDNFAEMAAGNGTNFTSTVSAPYTTAAGWPLIREGVAVAGMGQIDFRARTQAGLSRNGAQLMLFACGSGMTEPECAEILVTQFGAFHVLGLDGGGSTTLVLRNGASQDIIAMEGGERAVGANLGVQAGPYVAGIPDTMSWDADPMTPGIQQGAGTWDFTSTNWVAAGTNRVWANPKTPVLGAGGGAMITLGGRVGVLNMSVAGGYTVGTNAGPKITLLGDVTTTGLLATTINAPLGDSTSFTKKGGQTLTLGTGSRISMLNMDEGTIDLSGQTFTILDRLNPMTLNGGVIQNGGIIFDDSDPKLTVPSGSAALNVSFVAPKITKTGAGTVTFGGLVDVAGSIVVSGGVMRLNSAVSLPTTAVTVASGQLDLNGATGTVSSLLLGGVAGAGSELSTGGNLLTLGGNVTYTTNEHGNGATISGKVAMSAARTFTVNNSTNAVDDLTVSAAISGAFSLTKAGAGTLVLSGSNNFTSVTMNDGTIRCGAANALPANGAVTMRKGLLDLAGYDCTLGAITMQSYAGEAPELRSGAGLLTLGNNFSHTITYHGNGARVTGRLNLPATRTFTIYNSTNAPTDTTITASIEGAGGFTKKEAGKLVLGGALTFAGTFTVDNGEVVLTGPNSTVNAITLGGIANVTPVLDTGSTTLGLAGPLTYSSAGNGLGTVLKGYLDLGTTVRTFNIANSTNAPVDARIEACLSGRGGLAKTGAGTLELAGSNALTGSISMSAGFLRLSHASALGAATSLTFNASSTVEVAVTTLHIDSPDFTLSGAGVLDGNLSMSAGRISNTNGTLNITGDLTLSGGTTECTVGTATGSIVVAGATKLGGTLKVNMKGAPLTGTQTKLLLTGGSLTGNFTSVSLPIPPVGTTYRAAVVGAQLVLNVTPATATEKWLALKGLAADTPLSWDNDSDGWILLQEYVLGGDPGLPEAEMISVAVPANTLQLKFSYNTNATDVTIDIASSSNLAAWTTILLKANGSASWSGIARYVQGPATNGLAPITVNDTETGESPRFLRLELSKP